MARLFPFKYKEFYRSNSCIYKATFGTKYFLVKAKALKQSVEFLMEDIDRKIRLGIPEGHIISKVVKHIQSARPASAFIEVLLESTDHGELIYFERKALKAAESDPKCLNISFEPYMPAWISKEKVENYKPNKDTDPAKKTTTLVKTKPAPVKKVKIKHIPPISDSGTDFDIDAISSAIDKINAAKDLKTRN